MTGGRLARGMETPPLDILLSDRFVEFSKQIEAIHVAKKTMKAEFKKQYDAFQKKIDDLDAQAKKLMAEFENWKKELALTAKDD